HPCPAARVRGTTPAFIRRPGPSVPTRPARLAPSISLPNDYCFLEIRTQAQGVHLTWPLRTAATGDSARRAQPTICLQASSCESVERQQRLSILLELLPMQPPELDGSWRGTDLNQNM